MPPGSVFDMTTTHVSCASAIFHVPSTLNEVDTELQRLPDVLTEKLHEELTCVVCGSIFIDPRILRCHHCFCLRCLYRFVSRSRSQKIAVSCAFRCTEVTTADGDVRSLPKNHYVANATALLRQHYARRALLLRRKLDLLHEGNPVAGAAVCLKTDEQSFKKTSPASLSSAPLLPKHEMHAVEELVECEWCSCSSPTCEVCPYCWSRVCAECRGEFADHHYLCVSARRCERSRIPKRCSGVHAAPGAGCGDALLQGGEAIFAGRESADPIAAPLLSASRHPPFSFRVAPMFVSSLVERHLLSLQGVPLHASEIQVLGVTPLRLVVPEYEVRCHHDRTGVTCDYRVCPTVRTHDGVEVNLRLQDFPDERGEFGSIVSLLAFATRLGETVSEELARFSSIVSDTAFELSSVAHRASVRRNKGLHMYALHVFSLGHAECMIVHATFLPTLQRMCAASIVRAEKATHHHWRAVQHEPALQRPAIINSLTSFSKAEKQLHERLTVVMDGINAACCGLHMMLEQLVLAMRDLVRPGGQRGEDPAKRHQIHSQQHTAGPYSSSSPLQPPTCSFQQPHHASREPVDSAVDERPPSERVETLRRCGRVWQHVQQRWRWPPFSANVPSRGSFVEDELRWEDGTTAIPAEYRYRIQFERHAAAARTLTTSLVSSLRCFMLVRRWEWSLTNFVICGISGDETIQRRLRFEGATIQTITDELLHSLWYHARIIHVLEVDHDKVDSASSLELLAEPGMLQLLDDMLHGSRYDHSTRSDLHRQFSQLLTKTVTIRSGNAGAELVQDAETTLLKMAMSLLNMTIAIQVDRLRVLLVDAKELQSGVAQYLRAHQLNPCVGPARRSDEHTLHAVGVLTHLQVCCCKYIAVGQAHRCIVTPVAAYAGTEWDVNMEGTSEMRSDVGFESLGVSTDATPPPPPALQPPLSDTLFKADFVIRDMALTACQAYGEALVKTSAGESFFAHLRPFEAHRGEPSNIFGAYSVTATTAAPFTDDAAESLVREASSIREGFPPTASGAQHWRRFMNRERPSFESATLDAAPAQSGESEEGSTPAFPTATQRSVGEEAGENVTARQEQLFAVDVTPIPVPLESVEELAGEADGPAKASRLFMADFEIGGDATVGPRRYLSLPFYRGESNYKGERAIFYVDAQTGATYMKPLPRGTTRFQQRALLFLSSPLLFFVLSSVLHLYRRRYTTITEAV